MQKTLIKKVKNILRSFLKRCNENIIFIYKRSEWHIDASFQLYIRHVTYAILLDIF